MINGYTSLALTKLDVLDQLDEIKVCIAYIYNGQKLNSFPANISILEKIEVEYKTFKGWKCSTSELRNYASLPEKAKIYVEFIEKFLKVPIRFIGVGKEREAVIEKNLIF
jgi:adenylosuccinate synthase